MKHGHRQLMETMDRQSQVKIEETLAEIEREKMATELQDCGNIEIQLREMGV